MKIKARNSKSASKGKRINRPSASKAVEAVKAGGRKKAEKIGNDAIKATKQAAKAGKGGNDGATSVPTISYKNDQLMRAGIRHCRNKGGFVDFALTTKKSESIKAGHTIEGVHGYRVAAQDCSEVVASRHPGKSAKFVANGKVLVDGVEYPVMTKPDDIARTQKEACFAVYLKGKKVHSCLLRAEGWVKKANLTSEVVGGVV